MSEWENIPSDEERDSYHGFTYKITNKLNGKYYIGKKNYWKINKKKPTKYKRKDGKFLKDNKGNRIPNTRTTKTHTKVDHDWIDYYGSSKKLEADIEKYGKENFRREIIANYNCNFDLSLAELMLQLEHNVLFDKMSYNEIINVRLRKQKSFIKE